jgi:hypothetical protein
VHVKSVRHVEAPSDEVLQQQKIEGMLSAKTNSHALSDAEFLKSIMASSIS